MSGHTKNLWIAETSRVGMDDPYYHICAPTEKSKNIVAGYLTEANAKRIADCVNACNGMDIPFNVITRTRQRLAIVVNNLKYIGSINHGLDSDAMHEAIDELLEEQKKFDEDWPRG